MTPRAAAQRDRTIEMAESFLADVRRDLERATASGCDLPPRLRSVHVRAGHATPEYRTLEIPATSGSESASPELLSALIARYAAVRPPCCMILTLDGLSEAPDGTPCPILIAEARDNVGTRAYWMQPFQAVDGRIEWEEPAGGGWQDPEEQELILDLAFTTLEAAAQPAPVQRATRSAAPHLVS